MHKFPTDYPRPRKEATTFDKFGDVRTDDYYWMKHRESPEVITHLTKENDFTAEVMKPVKTLEEQLFVELKSRIKEDESSVPAKKGNYFYTSRYEVGQQYPLFVRTLDSVTGKEEVLMDVPTLAKGHKFFMPAAPRISPDQKMMAYGSDVVGRRFFNFYFKDLETGKVLPDKLENISPNIVWANDNETVFYAQQNPETLRSENIYRYNLRTKKLDLIYHEKDETFSAFVYKSLSEKYIYITTQSTLTTEVRYLNADHPQDSFKVFAAREREHEYSVYDDGRQFYILTNKNAKNFRVMTADLKHTDVKHWKELIPHRDDTYVEGVTVFKNNLVLEQRKNGLTQLEITDLLGKNSYVIPFADESYLASVGDNREFDTEWLRFDYESMRLPPSVYDINMRTHEQVLKKVHEVPNYNAEKYKTQRVFISVRDGVKVPVSLIMLKEHKLDGTAPMLVYGYGSYGANMDPWFNSDIFSLVDRGFVFAKAHIRGGSEMGRDWYDNGRTGHKKNTFFDFIDVTESLVSQKYSSPKKVYAMGGSAGGLLMGAVMNFRPDLYKGIVAQVPFVDVMTTMLDPSIPLTTGEYDEWGDPNQEEAYKYIRTYSPYDNVEKKAYPNLLATTGLHDSQVQYWEPAKWVAKIRDNNQAGTVTLLKTDMEAGHGGASGRFDALKDTATEYAFILMLND